MDRGEGGGGGEAEADRSSFEYSPASDTLECSWDTGSPGFLGQRTIQLGTVEKTECQSRAWEHAFEENATVADISSAWKIRQRKVNQHDNSMSMSGVIIIINIMTAYNNCQPL